jgi:hypothetical protein
MKCLQPKVLPKVLRKWRQGDTLTKKFQTRLKARGALSIEKKKEKFIKKKNSVDCFLFPL